MYRRSCPYSFLLNWSISKEMSLVITLFCWKRGYLLPNLLYLLSRFPLRCLLCSEGKRLKHFVRRRRPTSKSSFYFSHIMCRTTYFFCQLVTHIITNWFGRRSIFFFILRRIISSDLSSVDGYSLPFGCGGRNLKHNIGQYLDDGVWP